MSARASPLQLLYDVLRVMDIGLVPKQPDIVIRVQIVDIQTQALADLGKSKPPLFLRQRQLRVDSPNRSSIGNMAVTSISLFKPPSIIEASFHRFDPKLLGDLIHGTNSLH